MSTNDKPGTGILSAAEIDRFSDALYGSIDAGAIAPDLLASIRRWIEITRGEPDPERDCALCGQSRGSPDVDEEEDPMCARCRDLGGVIAIRLLVHIDAIAPPPGEVDAEAPLLFLSDDKMDPLCRLHLLVEYPGEPAGEQGLITLQEEELTSRSPRAEVTKVRNAIDLTHVQAEWLRRALGRVLAAGRLAGEARPPGATCEGCATLRERLATAERERDELRERVAELEAAPGGVAVAGLLRAIAAEIQEEDRRRVKAAVERRDRAAGEHILRRTALLFALGLAREHLAAPTPEQRAAAEVLALGQRYQPDSETSAADYLDHIETLASGGLPLDEPWEEVRTDRDRCKWAAAMALCGIVACDAKPGGGT